MTDNKRDHVPIQFNLGNSLMASVAPLHQHSTADEEVPAESDEPSDNCKRSLLSSRLQRQEDQNNMYKKQTIQPARSHKGDSLLTRAIISDSEPLSNEPSICSRVAFRLPKRGMSTTSTSSMPSTADLTSDASDSPSSALSSPSPRVGPVFVLPLIAPGAKKDTVVINDHSDEELHKTVQADPNPVFEALGRKRCITFACPNPVSRQSFKPAAVVVPKLEQPTPIRRTTLKFACDVKDVCKAPKKPQSPPPPAHKLHRSPVAEANGHHRRDSAATVVDERKGAIPCKSSHLMSSISSAASIPRFYEFASSVDESVESWMNAPQFPSRLIKVDCLLEKERQIRRLSEEVDDEVALEEDEEQADDVDDYNDDEEEDDGYKEDEEDEEYEMWSDSDEDNGSEDDDEEALGSDEEDDYVPVKSGTIIPDRQADRPTCCRNTSDSSLASIHHSRKPGLCSFQREHRTTVRSIRPRTPVLPDSTDFVPGTFDEDKVMEDYYLSCMEEKKSMNKVLRPQDIDPSFPVEDNDDDDEEEEEERRPSRRRGSNAAPSSHSRSPRGSPAPMHRHRSPPPMARRGSRGMSPGKRRPSFTSKSPPPQGRTGRLRFDFNTRASLARSTSLPRNGVCNRRKQCLGVTSTSPKPSKAITFRRGALDIVKGLEKKRMRRREHFYGRREWRAEAGEGVEKMREIGMMGKLRLGANAPPKFVISV
ncbi:hypothetical protein TWF694_010781 [Orbilia ellipsospora]|uniref:Uncharacterized protein n=1 Tax=Orbilia ellipsospora TaxID=2528407 RepID=A0AAV9X7F9_9PEZI